MQYFPFRTVSAVIAALAVQGAAASAAATGAPVQPPASFKMCAVCHSVSAPGKGPTLGPNLRGIVGRKAAGQPNYPYSNALKTSGISWTRDKLDLWLAGPTKMVPGTRMMIGAPKPDDRKAIIDYLATLK